MDLSLLEEYKNKIQAYEKLLTFLNLIVSNNIKDMKKDLLNNPSLKLLENMIDSYYVKAIENIESKSLRQLKYFPDIILLQYSNAIKSRK